MQKMIVAHPEKCTGCRICEMVCTVNKEGVVNPLRARIRIVRWEDIAVEMPMICQQCESPPCMEVCPVNAIHRDNELGRVMTDYEVCIGRKMCMVVCPFGSISFDPVVKKVIRCDQCDGDPMCVKFCETKAIEYVDTDAFSRKRRREAAEKLPELVQGIC